MPYILGHKNNNTKKYNFFKNSIDNCRILIYNTDINQTGYEIDVTRRKNTKERYGPPKT